LRSIFKSVARSKKIYPITKKLFYSQKQKQVCVYSMDVKASIAFL